MAGERAVIRHKRFKVKDANLLQVYLELPTGMRIEGSCDNCSLSGIKVVVKSVLLDVEGLDIGAIIPALKLKAGENEFTLGRAVVRQLDVDNNANISKLALSLVDSKVPIDGALSKYLDIDLDQNSSSHSFEIDPDKFNLSHFVESNNTNVDLFERTRKFKVFYEEWIKKPKYTYQLLREESMGVRVNLTRKRKNGRNDYIIMGSNDYLGLAARQEVIEAAKTAVNKYGFGSTGSPMTTGQTILHEELSDTLSRIFKKQKTILYNSGYAANVGTIPALVAVGDLVVADLLSHASIQDGINMSKATSRFFKHNEPQHLSKVLQENRYQHNGAMVVTEGVFSMDGDVAPLAEIVAVARKHNARVYLDEAHSFGVIGPKGMGTAEKYDLLDKVDVIMGTFSKICGGIGGFISCEDSVADWLVWLSRSRMFSVSIPPSTAAAALTAIQIFLREPQLLGSLRHNIEHFVGGLRELGCPISANHESAVIPFVVGDEKKMGEMNQILMESGVFVVPIVYPAVSRKNCRFRFTIMANHSVSDLDFVLNVLQRAMKSADFQFDESHQKIYQGIGSAKAS